MFKRIGICIVSVLVLMVGVGNRNAIAMNRGEKTSVIALMLAGVPQDEDIEKVRSIPEQGDRGEHILQIKKQLQNLGYYRPTATLNDEFNSTMVERLKMFQKNNGLTATGKYDIRTEMKMLDEQGVVTGQWYTKPVTPKSTNESVENASSFEVERTGSNECTISRYIGDSTTVIIPQSIRGLSVTEIRYCAFENCRDVRKIVIPEGIKRIGEMAFNGCKALNEIQLPESLMSIDDRAFVGCESLEEIKLPDCIIDIGENPFMGCDVLNAIIISEKHPRYRFADGMLIDKNEKRLISLITNESDVNITGDIVEIGPFACASMKDVKKIVISDGVVRIGEWAFNACEKLQEVQLPPSVTQIERGAFCNAALLRTVNIPYGIKTIEENTFDGCMNLTSEEVFPLRIPSSVEEIKTGAFEGCSRLRVIVIPKSVKKIGNRAFWNCRDLWKVRILGGNETVLGKDVFYGCEKLQYLVGY